MTEIHGNTSHFTFSLTVCWERITYQPKLSFHSCRSDAICKCKKNSVQENFYWHLQCLVEKKRVSAVYQTHSVSVCEDAWKGKFQGFSLCTDAVSPGVQVHVHFFGFLPSVTSYLNIKGCCHLKLSCLPASALWLNLSAVSLCACECGCTAIWHILM